MTALPTRLIPRLCGIGTLLVLLAIAFAASAPAPSAQTSAPVPAGLTANALDGSVDLAWRPATGATGYRVYRGTSATTINQLLTPSPVATTTFGDTTPANGTTYYYAVRAVSGTTESGAGQIAQARPRAASCATGNAIVVENCRAGSTGWRTELGTRPFEDGIEGFLSETSVDAGESVDLRVRVGWDVPYRVEIYRTGHYGGDQGRLVSVVPGLTGEWPPGCETNVPLGLSDCSNWPVAATISTTGAWTSGVYLLKLIREDNGAHNEALLVVRDDGNHSDVSFMAPTTTYQAYNATNGKAMYTGLSDPPATVTGATRAAAVSFDRPYAQPTDPYRFDWYTRTDVATVSWLEQQGYDVSYIANEDLHAHGDQAKDHDVLISGSHDEYWSQEMFDAALEARDSGTSLMFLGANAVYWRVRFGPSPVTGRANRVMTAYKTIESGPVDPSGHSTSTWRDPAGPNQPENELIGQLYIGQNIHDFFPLRVSADQGRNRIWRYTGLDALTAGTTASIGTGIVGWEWDARRDNGSEPANVQTVAETPVNGFLEQNNGASLALGNSTTTATLYSVASGAKVFSTGTNNWWRGLARNVLGQGEPNDRIRQATANLLADMGARPSTPAAGLSVDPLGAPVVTGTTPANGATNAAPDQPLRIALDRELDPSTVDDGDVTVTDPGGQTVAADVSFDSASRSLVIRPDDQLEPLTNYTARLGTGVKTWTGSAPAFAHVWSFATGLGAPPSIVSTAPAAGSTGAATDVEVRARASRRLDPATVTTSTVSLRTSGGTVVPAAVTYDDATRSVVVTPGQVLAESAQYTLALTTGVHARDGVPMASAFNAAFATGTDVEVSDRRPAPFSNGLATTAVPRATFSRAVDAATVNSANFRLSDPSGQVAATVSYDGATRTASLRPTVPLALLTTYTVAVSGVRGADGARLEPASWTFTTAAVPPPTPVVTLVTPTADATGVINDMPVRATFDQPMDASTVNAQTFRLVPDGGSPVAATVTYDALTRRATLTPLAPLAVGQRYTATLTTGIQSDTGAPLGGTSAWSFTTAECPCSLMSRSVPTQRDLPVQDFRPGAGPFSYEVGTRITVDRPSELIALRYFKEPGEVGTHVGRVWNASGTQVASVTFAGEATEGWQRQALATPLTLSAGHVYTVSVGLNHFYSKTLGGFAQTITSGPLSSASGSNNGVFAEQAGQFPSNSWGSSNYFVDGVVRLPDRPRRVPAVVTQQPLSGATGVALASTVSARFNYGLDPVTVNATTVTVRDSANAAVAGTVSYDEETQTVRFTPASQLDGGETYTVRLTTGIQSDDGSALASQVTWSFTTVPPGPPTVLETSPASAATGVSSLAPVTARFAQAMDASTITGATFTLIGPGGASVPASVSYNAATRTATLAPSAVLAPSTAYTARLDDDVQSARDVSMAAPYSWSFTTSECPCGLYGDAAPTVGASGLSTQNYRPGAGPWSLELGVKIRVSSPTRLEAIRFWKDAAETGTHVGRLWTASGTLLATTTFTSESGSGWQRQALSTPVALTPGQTYVVSVGMNAAFGMTSYGLAAERGTGPLRSVADGANGVYGDAAGDFPSQTWASSDYLIDAEIR